MNAPNRPLSPAASPAPPPPSAGTRGGGGFRWIVCALLFFACTVNYMDRQVLGLLKPDLSRTFQWSETDYSRMAIFFQLAYALGQAGFGSFMNWFWVKRAYSVSVLFWSLSAMSHAFCRTVSGFCGAR